MLLKVAHHGGACGTAADLLGTTPAMRPPPSARATSTLIPGAQCFERPQQAGVKI